MSMRLSRKLSIKPNMQFAQLLHRAVALFAALALVCASAACSSNPSGAVDATGNARKKVSFMLAWVPDTNHIGVYVAQARGLYEKYGLDVDIVAVAQAGAEQAVANGLADFALSNGTNVTMASLKGAQLRQVLQVQRKPSAIWCALASNTDIRSPKDFDGKTFATFGSNESDAVVREMIINDGGTGNFDKVTVGTSTFQTLQSGKADFGGFYATWEGVQASMYGPKLTCFNEPDYGIPGNADSIGIITSQQLIQSDPDTVSAFVKASQEGYLYAYQHPDEAAHMLVTEAGQANLDEKFVQKSMHTIVDGQYWGSLEDITSGKLTFGSADVDSIQAYIDFLASHKGLSDEQGGIVTKAPDVSTLVTDDFLPETQAQAQTETK